MRSNGSFTAKRSLKPSDFKRRELTGSFHLKMIASTEDGCTHFFLFRAMLLALKSPINDTSYFIASS